MCVWRNIEARSCVHCYGGKAISITYCECVLLAWGIQHAMRMRHIVICDLPRSTIFFPRSLINDTIFEKMFLNTKYKFWFPLESLSENFLILRRNERDVVKHRYWSSSKVPFILYDFSVTLISRQFFFQKKYLKIKLHKNLSSGSRVVPYGRTDEGTDITQLTVALRNFAKAPKISFYSHNVFSFTFDSQGNFSTSMTWRCRRGKWYNSTHS